MAGPGIVVGPREGLTVAEADQNSRIHALMITLRCETVSGRLFELLHLIEKSREVATPNLGLLLSILGSV